LQLEKAITVAITPLQVRAINLLVNQSGEWNGKWGEMGGWGLFETRTTEGQAPSGR